MHSAFDTVDPKPVGAADPRVPAQRLGEEPLVMVKRPPRVTTVDRARFLLQAARGRRVTHVGFAEEGSRSLAQRDGGWMHERLARVSSSLVGIDIEEEGVAQARALGYEVYLADCRVPADIVRQRIPPADLVVAGEVIEHIDSVGPFLDGLHNLAHSATTLIVTTPNAFRLSNFAASLCGIELVHPDHVAWYSWFTLRNVLERHGWKVERFHTYLRPWNSLRAPARGTTRGRMTVGAGRLVFGLERAVAGSVAPFLADGLIAVCRPFPPTSGAAPRD